MLSFEKQFSRFISPLQGKRKKVKISLAIWCEKKNKPQLQQPFVTFVFLHSYGHPVRVKLAFSREGPCPISKPRIQTCGWIWVMSCCMEPCEVCVRCSLPCEWGFLPAGDLAFPVVANVRGCRPGAPGSAKGHNFLGWGFWGELPAPVHGVAVRALGLLSRGGVALGGAGDGNGPGQGWLLLPCSLCSVVHTLLWNVKCCCTTSS